MYYDLNIPWPAHFSAAAGPSNKASTKAASKSKKQKQDTQAQSKDGDSLVSAEEQNISAGLSGVQYSKMKALTVDLRDLGYSTCAYNHIIQSKFESARHRNPFSTSQQPQHSQAPFPDLRAKNSDQNPQTGKIRQLSRMTLIMDEKSMGKEGHGMINASTSALLTYDLLSAQAFNDASFSLLCLTMSELKPSGIDIISLELSTSPRLPFFLKRSTVNAAIANGVVFEICYSQVVNRGGEGDGSSKQARKNIISGARDILRITNGKGVIFSSGAMDIMGLRGPNDIVNLAAIFGLNQAAAKDAISSTCRSLILRAETRKTFRGVVGEPALVHIAKEQNTKRKADDEAQQQSKRSKVTPIMI